MKRIFTIKNCPFKASEEHDSDEEIQQAMVKPSRKTIFRTSALEKLAPFNWIHLTCLIAVVSLLQLAVRLEIHRFPSIPDPATFGIAPESVNKNLLDTDQFVTARARNSLNKMSGFGVRPAGSLAAERLTVDWLVGELENLRKQQKPDSPTKLHITVDQVSGFFNLGSITSVYANITNVLARLDPVFGDKNNALLINCHFDSFFEAIAASDDAVNCAVMLEILRALMSSSSTPLKHSVIFLFNGAEENILQASHGFIAGSSKDGSYVDGAGHPWAKTVRAFINLEAAGSGGREILFQTGPGAATPILVRAYAAAAPYPFASVVGQEVFQAGLIPSDTDFRIFRDYGHIPGMDFAFYSNGFVYHTSYDTPDRIGNGTIQSAGSNWLAVVKELASSNLTKIPPVDNPNDSLFDDKKTEKLVYFDIFSTFLIVYPFKTVGLAMNILAILGTIGRIGCRFYKDSFHYGTIFFVALFAHLVATGLAVGVLFLIATLIGATHSYMFWFAKTWLLFPVYALPAVASAFLTHAIFFKFAIVPLCATANFAEKCTTGYDISFDAAIFICSIGLGAFSAYSLATSYILLIWVGVPLLTASLMPLSKNASALLLTIRHTVVTIIPTVYFFYVADPLLEIFVPVTGRDGMGVNPDYIIAALVLFVVVFLLLFHSPAVYLSGGNVAPVVGSILFITVAMLTAIILTPFGQPFSMEIGRSDGARVQRSATQLTLQKTDSKNSKVHSGIWFIPSDFVGIQPIERIANNYLKTFFEKSRTPCISSEDIADNSFCSLANIYPVARFELQGTYWVDVNASAETAKQFNWPTVRQTSKSSTDNSDEVVLLLQFRINCGETPHCAVYISPHDGIRPLRWHFGDYEIPVNKFPRNKLRSCPFATGYTPSPTWMAMLRFGSPSSDRKGLHYLFLTMEVTTVNNNPEKTEWFDFKVASQYFRGSSSIKMPMELTNFVKNLPHWHHTYPVTTLYSTFSL